jgi:hypothetical protein
MIVLLRGTRSGQPESAVVQKNPTNDNLVRRIIGTA